MTSALKEMIDDRTASLFRAVSHPSRVGALVALADGERPVGDLSRDLGIEASAMSYQLAVLRRAGLVRSRRDGSVILYRLSGPDVAVLLEWSKVILTGSLARSERLLVALRGEPTPSDRAARAR